MESNSNYKLLIINHKKTDDHIEYQIRINYLKNDISIDFFERYSNLKTLHDNLRKETSAQNFPKFPPKKFFGSTDEKFLNQRQTELNSYFEQIFNSNEFSQLPSLKKWIEDSLKKYRKDGTKIKDNQIPSPSNNNNINNIQQEKTPVIKKNNNSQLNEENNKNLIDDFNNKLIDIENYLNDANKEDYEYEKKLQEAILKTGIFSEKEILTSKLFKIENGNDENFDLIGKNYDEFIDNENNINKELDDYFHDINERVQCYFQTENLIVPI